MAGIPIEPGETRVLSVGFNVGPVKNNGPGTVVIEGRAVAPGDVWAPSHAFVRDFVVTSPLSTGASLTVNAGSVRL